jgi:hypothetical protein
MDYMEDGALEVLLSMEIKSSRINYYFRRPYELISNLMKGFGI